MRGTLNDHLQRSDGVWEQYADEKGNRYYFNTATQETLWENEFLERTKQMDGEKVATQKVMFHNFLSGRRWVSEAHSTNGRRRFRCRRVSFEVVIVPSCKNMNGTTCSKMQQQTGTC